MTADEVGQGVLFARRPTTTTRGLVCFKKRLLLSVWDFVSFVSR